MSETPSVNIEAGWCVIRVPAADRAELLADLAECSCRATKSTATAEVRQQFREAMADPPARIPLRDIHGLRVALAACPCRGPDTATATIRQRLATALGRLKT